jgi:hypothetical protein
MTKKTAPANVMSRSRAVILTATLLTPFAGCARTAVVVDNPPPNTQTVVTVEHVPQTQPTDKDLIIRNKN